MQLPQSAQNFLIYAQKCKPFWAKMKGGGVTNYTKTGVAKATPGLGNQKKWSEPYMRAKCKAGIGFVIDNGFTIRFALDSLWTAEKMETVARKETDQPWHTGSELRYLLKRKDDQRTGNQVVFYVKGARVAAPWTAFAPSWSAYGQTRMDRVPDDFRRT
jgi:hypothetical protein